MRHIIWRNRASAILGIVLMLVPFSGLPQSLKTLLVVGCGFLIAVFGFYHGSSNYVIKEENEGKEDKSEMNEIKSKRVYHRTKKEPEILPPEPTLGNSSDLS